MKIALVFVSGLVVGAAAGATGATLAYRKQLAEADENLRKSNEAMERALVALKSVNLTESQFKKQLAEAQAAAQKTMANFKEAKDLYEGAIKDIERLKKQVEDAQLSRGRLTREVAYLKEENNVLKAERQKLVDAKQPLTASIQEVILSKDPSKMN